MPELPPVQLYITHSILLAAIAFTEKIAHSLERPLLLGWVCFGGLFASAINLSWAGVLTLYNAFYLSPHIDTGTALMLILHMTSVVLVNAVVVVLALE